MDWSANVREFDAKKPDDETLRAGFDRRLREGGFVGSRPWVEVSGNTRLTQLSYFDVGVRAGQTMLLLFSQTPLRSTLRFSRAPTSSALDLCVM